MLMLCTMFVHGVNNVSHRLRTRGEEEGEKLERNGCERSRTQRKVDEIVSDQYMRCIILY